MGKALKIMIYSCRCVSTCTDQIFSVPQTELLANSFGAVGSVCMGEIAVACREVPKKEEKPDQRGPWGCTYSNHSHSALSRSPSTSCLAPSSCCPNRRVPSVEAAKAISETVTYFDRYVCACLAVVCSPFGDVKQGTRAGELKEMVSIENQAGR